MRSDRPGLPWWRDWQSVLLVALLVVGSTLMILAAAVAVVKVW